MNRTAILFLALAVMLAHMVAIHQTPAGEFAPPYDVAHVAFRLGRNLVHDADLAWNRGQGIHSSYPSLLWVGLCAGAERLYLSPIAVTQAVGMLCVLGSVLVLTRFSQERRAGLIAPLLLATSGAAAAAGTSGTEAPLSMLLLTAVVLGFERRRPLLQGVAGMLLAMTQPTATWAIAMVLLLELFDRPVDAARHRARRRLLPALAPFVALGGLLLLRHAVTGDWWTPTTRALLDDPLGQARLGLAYLSGFLLSSGSAPLLVAPVLLLSSRRTAGVARRSLLITAAWFVGVALTGGSGLPFWNALAPVLPVGFLSVQAACTRLMDRRRGLQPVVLAALLLGGAASLVVSKVPGSIGPLHTEDLHRAWVTPGPLLRATYGTSHGRLGLLEEIRRVERLRQIGLFLREESAMSATVGTAWPGAIGYLSRREVHDLLGRTTPPAGSDHTTPWTGSQAAVVGATLLRDYDVLASVRLSSTVDVEQFPEHREHLRHWLGRPGEFGPSTVDEATLTALLERYEPVSVPVFAEGRVAEVPEPNPALLLRRRGLDLSPLLRVALDGDVATVFAEHRGPPQVVDLTVRYEGADGVVRTARPTGEWVPLASDVPALRARTDVLLFDTGTRAVQLFDVLVPAEFGAGRLTAQLLDWGGSGREDWAVGAPATIER